jgi:hypothetical protein
MDPKENGQQLISLLDDFKRRVTEKNIRLTCFTEEILTEIGDSTKVRLPPYCLRLSEANVSPIRN